MTKYASYFTHILAFYGYGSSRFDGGVDGNQTINGLNYAMSGGNIIEVASFSQIDV